MELPILPRLPGELRLSHWGRRLLCITAKLTADWRLRGHNLSHAAQKTSVRAFAVVSFVYLSVECPSDKFYGINCRPKLSAKLLDRFFHRRRQVSPPVNRLTHRFFDGSDHFLYCNFTVGYRHGAVASSFSR